jgi:cellobiose dehydrogenase (acceptor)
MERTSFLLSVKPGTTSRSQVNRSQLKNPSVHSSPTLYAPGTAAPTLITIPPGTFVNSTHLSYTFVCSLCITSNSVAFSPTASTIKLGWSLSNQNVTNPASTTAATFKFHNVGYGSYTLDFADAKSSSYSSWTLLGNATTKISKKLNLCKFIHID